MRGSVVDQVIRAVETGLAAKRRVIVAIAGPPGSGKSTVAADLKRRLDDKMFDGICALAPMDGFHFDNAVIAPLGLLLRKGAPETFDFEGYFNTLTRLRGNPEQAIAVPVFDRSLDLARAGATVIKPEHRVVVTEGNYLLLDQEPWPRLGALFDLTVFIEADQEELERRLIERWLGYGMSPEAARKRARGNDLINTRLVMEHSRRADFAIAQDRMLR